MYVQIFINSTCVACAADITADTSVYTLKLRICGKEPADLRNIFIVPFKVIHGKERQWKREGMPFEIMYVRTKRAPGSTVIKVLKF